MFSTKKLMRYIKYDSYTVGSIIYYINYGCKWNSCICSYDGMIIFKNILNLKINNKNWRIKYGKI